jgi:hypothetical protein
VQPKNNIPKNDNPMVTVSPRWNPTRRPCPTAGLAENVSLQGAVSGFCSVPFFNFLYKEGRDNKYIFLSESAREKEEKVGRALLYRLCRAVVFRYTAGSRSSAPTRPMAVRATGRSLFLGTFVHSKSLDELEYLKEAAVCVDEKGVIVAIEQDCDQNKAEQSLYPKLGWSHGDVTVQTAKEGGFFFPGFIGEFLRCIPNESSDDL